MAPDAGCIGRLPDRADTIVVPPQSPQRGSSDGERDLTVAANRRRVGDGIRVSLALCACATVFLADLFTPGSTLMTQLYPAAILLLYRVGRPVLIAGTWLCSIVLIGAGSSLFLLDKVGDSPTGRAVSVVIVSITAIAVASFSRHEGRLRRQALVDPLTGVFNRRSFMEFAVREEARTQRGGNTFAVLMMDIDHFKQVNDVYGHAAGDAVIRELADVATRTLRPTDVLARYGGEEFAVSLPDTTPDQARAVAERLREAVEATAVVSDNGAIRFTVSIGVASCSHSTPINDAIAQADMALYAAKRNGRNRVEVSSPAPGAATTNVPTEASRPEGTQAETVLIVDDEDDIRELMAEWLRQSGYAVRTATNAGDALRLIEGDSAISLLLTDIVMPGDLDGFALGQKAVLLRPGLKLLYVSGYDASATVRASGAEQVLQKPFRMNNMLERVAATLRS